MRSGRMSVLIQYKSDPLVWVTGGHPGKATKQVDIMSCPLQYYHIAVPSLCWNDTETDDKQREPMFNIWFTCYISLSANSSFISKEKEINIKVWQSLNQNYGSSFKYQHLLSPDSTLALKWWERRGPLTTMSGLGNGWFSADNYCRPGGRTGKGGDEVFHSEFTQRSMVRYPQTTQHSSAALTDSLNFWSGQIQPEHQLDFS